MGRKAKDQLSPISAAIIDVCRDLLGNWGGRITDFFRESGITQNYWYKRMRYELPFNTSDIDTIASFFGVDSLDIYQQATDRVKARKAAQSSPSANPFGSIAEQFEHATGRPLVTWTKAAYHDPDKGRERESGE